MSTPTPIVCQSPHPLNPVPVTPEDFDAAIASYLPASVYSLQCLIYERITGRDFGADRFAVRNPPSSMSVTYEFEEPDRLAYDRTDSMHTVTECLLVLADFDRTDDR